jgi:hypothetical protein
MQTHYRARYHIRFNIRPAGVDFELRFKGTRYNEANSFEVQWEEGAAISAPRELLDQPFIDNTDRAAQPDG